MRIQKIAALLMVTLWLLELTLVCGPIRWEFAHSYTHWIEGVGEELPTPTTLLGLPLLGIRYPNCASIILSVLIWLTVWGGPLHFLIKLFRASTVRQVRDLILFGGGSYGLVVACIGVLLAFSLWLPFSYLG